MTIFRTRDPKLDAATEEDFKRYVRKELPGKADALQLAAAMEWAGTPPDGAFVTFDERLGAAARRDHQPG